MPSGSSIAGDLPAEIETRIRAAIDGGHLPEQDAATRRARRCSARCSKALSARSRPRTCDDPARSRDAVQTLTLFALRGLGVVDAHARGLVVQTVLPDEG